MLALFSKNKVASKWFRTAKTKTPPNRVVSLSWYGYLDGGFEPIYMQRGRALPAAFHRSGTFIFALGKNANRIHHKHKKQNR